MNKRRNLLLGLGATALAPRVMFAQAKQPPVLIGWLHLDSRESGAHYLGVFKEALTALGWKEGSQIAIEERWADGRVARLQSLAEELAARKPAVIVAAPSNSIGPMAKAAPKTPIVQASGGDPTASGLVKSLARPGGMITGLTNLGSSITEKYIELLLAAAPKVKRVGVLDAADLPDSFRALPADSTRRAAVRRSAAQHSIEAHFAEIADPESVEPAIARLAKDGVQALVVMQYSILRVERRRIMKLALAQRWPVIAGVIEFAEEGALITYSADVLANYRRAAWYVDRILKGAKPGDIPIEQPTKFELVVNLKTAKTLGLTIPQPFLMRATRVIE